MSKPRASPSRRLLDSAAWLAAISAVLYLVGRLYLDTYYGRLGLMETQVMFDVPFVMMNSFLPLLHPVMFLVMAAIIFSGLPPVAERSAAWRPFHPLRPSQVVAIVTVTWAAKITVDHQISSAGIHWLAWDRRDVLFFLAGVLLLGGLYAAYWMRRVLHKRPYLTKQTLAFTWLIGGLSLLVVLLSISEQQWLLSAWRTAVIILGLAWTGLLVWRDLKTWPSRASKQGPTAPDAWNPSERGSALMLYTFAAFAILLAAGLQGSLAGKEALAGCDSIKTVTFDPPLAAEGENATYWLVLHHDGIYYVRDLPPESGNATIAVPEAPGRTAAIGTKAASRAC